MKATRPNVHFWCTFIQFRSIEFTDSFPTDEERDSF